MAIMESVRPVETDDFTGLNDDEETRMPFDLDTDEGDSDAENSLGEPLTNGVWSESAEERDEQEERAIRGSTEPWDGPIIAPLNQPTVLPGGENGVILLPRPEPTPEPDESTGDWYPPANGNENKEKAPVIPVTPGNAVGGGPWR
jgi:hypothetical protein